MTRSPTASRRGEFFWETIERLETENAALKDFIYRQMNHLDPGSPEEIHLLKQIVDERPRAA